MRLVFYLFFYLCKAKISSKKNLNLTFSKNHYNFQKFFNKKIAKMNNRIYFIFWFLFILELMLQRLFFVYKIFNEKLK